MTSTLSNFTEHKDLIMTACRRALDHIDAWRVDERSPLSAEEQEILIGLCQGVRDSMRRLEEGKFQIAVVGQMKAGKSTLVNASIFGKEIVPVAATPHTAKLTVIRHGERAQATATLYTASEWQHIEELAAKESHLRTPGGGPCTRYIAEVTAAHGKNYKALLGKKHTVEIDQLEDYVAAYNKENNTGRYTNLTQLVEVTYPTAWPEEVEFVDTPGTNDPDERREQITLNYLARADAVVLVWYAGQAGSKEDVTFLSRVLLPVGFSKIMVVLNKIDTVSMEERPGLLEQITRTLTTVATQHALNEGSSPGGEQTFDPSLIYPVSSVRALLGRTEGAMKNGSYLFRQNCVKKGISTYEEALSQSGIKDFEGALSAFLYKEKGLALLQTPLHKTRGTLDRFLKFLTGHEERLDAQLADLERNDAELAQDIIAVQRQFEALERNFSELEVEMTRMLRERVDEAKTRGEEKIRSFGERAYERAQSRFSQVSRIDAATSTSHVSQVNTDIGWMARSLEGDLMLVHEQTLRDIRRVLQGDFHDHLREVVPDRKDSAHVRAIIDGITRLDFQVTLPPIPSIQDERGFFSGLHALFFIEEYQQELTRRAQNLISTFEKSCLTHNRDTGKKLEEQALVQIREVMVEITRHYGGRLRDLEEAIQARRRSKQDMDSERQRLRDARHYLTTLREQVTGEYYKLPELDDASMTR